MNKHTDQTPFPGAAAFGPIEKPKTKLTDDPGPVFDDPGAVAVIALLGGLLVIAVSMVLIAVLIAAVS